MLCLNCFGLSRKEETTEDTPPTPSTDGDSERVDKDGGDEAPCHIFKKASKKAFLLSLISGTGSTLKRVVIGAIGKLSSRKKRYGEELNEPSETDLLDKSFQTIDTSDSTIISTTDYEQYETSTFHTALNGSESSYGEVPLRAIRSRAINLLKRTTPSSLFTSSKANDTSESKAPSSLTDPWISRRVPMPTVVPVLPARRDEQKDINTRPSKYRKLLGSTEMVVYKTTPTAPGDHGDATSPSPSFQIGQSIRMRCDTHVTRRSRAIRPRRVPYDKSRSTCSDAHPWIVLFASGKKESAPPCIMTSLRNRMRRIHNAIFFRRTLSVPHHRP